MSAVEPTVPETSTAVAVAAPAEPAAVPTQDGAVADDGDTKPEPQPEDPPLVGAAAEPPKDEPKETVKEHAVDEEPTTTLTPIAQLWTLAKAHAHPEIWGVTLADPDSHVPTQIVLQKYLNANDGDVAKAKDQLLKTLDWRAKMKPLNLMKKAFDKAKFGNLGYVTTYEATDGAADPELKEVFTWNIYGAVKSMDETFGNLDEFIEWRVALMELSLQELSLSSATKPITAEHDPYKILQVHDYKSISFLRQSPHVKAASTETIKVFAQNYPELLKEKFFVNVPAVMGFIYAFMKLFVAAKTIKKFHPMSNGANLAREFATSRVKGLGEMLPAEYGGKGADLKTQGKEPLLTE